MTRRLTATLVALAAIATLTVTIATSAAGRPARSAGRATATAAPAGAPSSRLAHDVLTARLATVKYATNLGAAQADGYRIITRMIPNMGFHYLNPAIKGFDLRHPAILVYERHAGQWQLGALEWVFTTMPSRPPLPGASYGVFGAACHYVDGTFVFAEAQSLCASTSPTTGAAFSFWHPRLITLHFWVWYPNPSGMYMGTNPLVAPYS